jgi:methyl-accepting chemotaxis protein
VTDVLTFAAQAFEEDPDEETAQFAHEVLRLIDTDQKLQQVVELVSAYEATPDATKACRSLAQIRDALADVGRRKHDSSSNETQQAHAQELLAATHRVAALALKTAAGFSQRSLRSQCMRIAMRCETDASRLQQELLWSSE